MILVPFWSPRQAAATQTIDVRFMSDLSKPLRTVRIEPPALT
jgi:hypothetical protein